MVALQRRLIWLLVLLVYSGMSVKAPAVVVIDWVDVGDPGNPENTIVKKDGTSGYGTVNYKFRMSQLETTNLQYIDFLNAVAATDTHGLYNTSMGTALEGGITRSGVSGSFTYSGKPNMDNKPVNHLSWFSAARFANWMQNGQLTGLQDASTTEDGAYTFSGTTTVGPRNSGAQFFIPNENEWEKTAYYQPGASTFLGDGWWQTAYQSDDFDNPAPVPAISDEFGNVINPGPTVIVYRDAVIWNGSESNPGSDTGNVATVGGAGNQSFYGAKDMSGNVFEWMAADPNKPDPQGRGPYVVRGGSYTQFGHFHISERNHPCSSPGGLCAHNKVGRFVGFRLAAAFLGPDSADFNNDTFVDGLDLALWEQAHGNSVAGDANNDGVSDGKDFLIWQEQSAVVPVSADFNNDTFVDGLDLALWEQAHGNSIVGDANNDGVSDGKDFLIWQEQSAGSAPLALVTQVPEQASWLLFCGVIVVFLTSRVERSCSRPITQALGLLPGTTSESCRSCG